MPRLNNISISEGLHGFVSYQIGDGVVDDGSRAALSLTNWAACGLFSVHHAFVFLGQGGSIRNLKNLHPGILDLFYFGLGTDKLRALIRRAGAKSEVVEGWKLKPVKTWVDRHLAKGHPVIVGSEPHCHWICIGGRTAAGDYVWADSAEHPTLGKSSWEVLDLWMTRNSKGEEVELKYPFEAIAVLPARTMAASRSIVPWVAGIWEIWASDPKYARTWSNLLADMLDVFWDAEYAPKPLPVGGFLEEHLAGIINAAAFQTGISQADLRSIAHGYRDVADFHSLVVPAGQEATAIAGFTLKLVARAQQSP